MFKKISFAIFVIAALSVNLFAQPQLLEKVETVPGKIVIPYEKWQLPNGMKVIMHEDHSDPLVNVWIVYHVGSAREVPGRSGFAHLFEHMMFQGSKHVKDEEHFKLVSEGGGENNGFTQNDLTTYFEVVPTNQLELGIWLEADRMGFLLDSLTERKFENQRSTVKNEKFENQLSVPYGISYEIMDQTLYPPGHPYSWPVIGYTDDLDRATVQDVRDFFMRWYGPNNATLVLAGDINPQETLKLVEKYFGPINRGPEVKKLRTEPVILPTNQYANIKDNIYSPMTRRAYPTVAKYNRDEPALDILGDMMGDGNNSIFYQKFVKPEKAVRANAYHYSQELSGVFEIEIMSYSEDLFGMDMEKHFNELELKIDSTIDEFGKTGITDEALQRAKAKKESSIMTELTTIIGKTSLLGEWDMFAPKAYNFQNELDRYNAVTKEDVIRVFNRYIKSNKAAIVNVYPHIPKSEDDTLKIESFNPNKNVDVSKIKILEGTGEWKYQLPVDNFDRAAHPKPATPKEPVVPDYYTFELKNGIKAIGTTTTEVPGVLIQLHFEGGDLFLPDQKKVGTTDLTASIMNEGTQNYTTEQVSAELEKLGSEINFYQGGATVRSLTKNLDATLKILEEKLMRPGFREDDFKRMKKQEIENYEQIKRLPQFLAGISFQKMVFANTTLGRYQTKKNLKDLSLNDLKNYYQQYFTPKLTKMVIVGNISEAEAKAKLDFLNKWEGKDVKVPEPSGFTEVPQTQIYIVHKPYTASTSIYIGHLSLKYDATGDYFKSRIANFELGGNFNSRLNLYLRENKGYTYGIRSGFQAGKYAGAFNINSSVRATATDTAVKDIMKTVNEYIEKGLTDEEYSFTKNSILNSEALKYEAPYEKANFLSEILEYNLPKDFTKQQSQILKNISKDELNSLAKKYIHPDKMIIVVAGNKYSLRKPLERLKLGKVSEVDFE